MNETEATLDRFGKESLDSIRLGNDNLVVSKAYGRPEQVTLHDLCDEIERLKTIVDKIADYAKVNESRAQIEPSRIRIADTLRAILRGEG